MSLVVATSRAKTRRNAELRQRRQQHRESLRVLARRFGIGLTRVVQILEQTGGDPVRQDLSRYGVEDLERMTDRLRDRIGADIRLLLNAEDELESRRVDRINGLAD